MTKRMHPAFFLYASGTGPRAAEIPFTPRPLKRSNVPFGNPGRRGAVPDNLRS